jgi:transcriptional regulator with XRE-family HTH domain
MDGLRVISGDMAKKSASPETLALSRRIKEKMDARGWKVEHLAVHTGLPYSTLATYFGDNPAEIKAVRLAPIARALGVSADELLGITASTDPSPGKRKKEQVPA